MKIILAILLCSVFYVGSFCQDAGFRTKTLKVSDSIRLDTLSIFPNSFKVRLECCTVKYVFGMM